MTTTPVSSILLVLLASFIGSFASVLLKAGAGRLHRDVRTLFFNFRLAGGVLMYVLSSYFFVQGVRRGELIVLYPMVAVGYGFTMLWSRLFFGEPFNGSKIVGLALIFTGIVILFSGTR